jgi:hypothetical protein
MAAKTVFVKEDDKVILSDLLYFIYNKTKSTPVKDVMTACLEFYNDDDYVFEEKQKLCDATGEKCIQRRMEGKRLANLEDISNLILRRDSNGEFLPKFASLDYNNIPKTVDGSATISQVLGAMNEMKRNLVTIEMFQSTIAALRNEHGIKNPTPDDPKSWPFLSSLRQVVETEVTTLKEIDVATEDIPPNTGDKPAPLAEASMAAVENVQSNSQDSFKRPRNPTKTAQGERHRSKSRPRFQTIIGKSVTSGLVSFKGADLTVSRYIGQIDNGVSDEVIKEHVTSKGVTVVELEALPTRHSRFKSFRLTVKKNELVTIENSDFWPEGVILRPFFRPRSTRETGDGTRTISKWNS